MDNGIEPFGIVSGSSVCPTESHGKTYRQSPRSDVKWHVSIAALRGCPFWNKLLTIKIMPRLKDTKSFSQPERLDFSKKTKFVLCLGESVKSTAA